MCLENLRLFNLSKGFFSMANIVKIQSTNLKQWISKIELVHSKLPNKTAYIRQKTA